MLNILSEINTATLPISIVVIMLFVIVTVAVALVAVFLIGKYHSVPASGATKVGSFSVASVVAIVFAIGLIVRLIVTFFINGYASSYDTVYNLANDVIKVNSGFQNYTANYSDVAPLTGYIYTLFGGWGVMLGLGQDDLMMQFFIKLPYIIADIAVFFIIYKVACKYVNKYVAIVLSSLFYLNPVFVTMSSAWGSVYALLLPFVLITAYFILTKNILGMTLTACASCLIHSHGVYLLPIVLVYMVYAFIKAVRRVSQQKPSLEAVFKDATLYNVFFVPLCIILGVAAMYVVSLPIYFADGVRSFPAVFGEIFVVPFSYASGALRYFVTNALNLFTVATLNYTSVGTNFPTAAVLIAFIVLITVVAAVVFSVNRNRANLVLLLSFISLTVAVYGIGMNEWSITPALLIMLFAYIVIKDKRLLKTFGLLSLIVTINALLVMLGGNQISPIFTAEEFNMTTITALNVLSIILSVFAVLVHIYYIVVVMDVSLTKRRKEFVTERTSSFAQIMKDWVSA